MTFFINVFLLFITYFYVYKNYRRDGIYILVALMVNGYILIIPGLTFIDIFSVIVFILNLRKVKKLSLFSISIFIYIVYQILVNLFFFSYGRFEGTILSTIVPVLHEYIPIFLLVVIIENVNINTKIFFESYRKFIYLLLVLFIVAKFVMLSVGEPSMKILTYTTSFSGVLALTTPYWFRNFNSSSINFNSFIVILFSAVIIYLSDTRGSLMIFIILMGVTLIPIIKKKVFLFIMPIISLIIWWIVGFISKSPQLISIVNLQFSLLTGIEPDFSLLTSSERVRYILWTSAKEVWMNNFFFGIGSNQFEKLGVLIDRAVQLSPHHAIYSIAVNGGIFAILLLFSPVLLILFTNNFSKNIEITWLKIYSMVYVFMAFMFGYSFNLYLLIFLYIATRKYISINNNYKIKVKS